MALNTQLANATANAQGDVLARLLDNGYLKVYSGTQPATGDTGLSGNTLLATLRFSATSAPSTVAGLITFNSMTSDTNAASSGTATWYRAFKSDNSTAVMDGSVGTVASNLVLTSTGIAAGQTVACASFTHSVLTSSPGL